MASLNWRGTFSFFIFLGGGEAAVPLRTHSLWERGLRHSLWERGLRHSLWERGGIAFGGGGGCIWRGARGIA